MRNVEDLLRQIPHVDKLMKNEIIAGSGVYRHEAADAVRSYLAELRDSLIKGEADSVPEENEIAARAVELAKSHANRGVSKVINGTGVILHSNLGRACLSKKASQAAYEAAASYCTLEYDVENGSRGSRTACIEDYLRHITGCDASMIVNNNAAAVLLILTAIAKGGNVVVSRGELVEIGGGFRIPEIMALSGCELREVGTTNKTRLSDYRDAIDGETRALLKVHASNFKIIGFSEAVALKDIAELGKSLGIPVIEDTGSGALTELKRYNIYNEPFAAESLKNGADIVSFSADKLLGGPQCGIILGNGTYITAMKKHPLYRALRTDKITIAALEATLRVYADPIAAEREIPVLSMLSLTEDTLKSRAESLCEEIRRRGGNADAVRTNSVAGGGAIPGTELDSYAITLSGGKSAAEYEQMLRRQPVPIIGHIDEGKLLLDVRTIFEEDFDYIVSAVVAVSRT